MTPKIVTFGGGTGAPAIIKSLILADFTGIQAVSAASDDGGRSGQIRTDERDQVISVGDLFKTLLALIPPDKIPSPHVQAFTDLVNFTDGRSRNLGYFIYYGLLEKYQGDFMKVQQHLERLLDLQLEGTAIPVSLEPAHLGFTTHTGSRHFGEHELDRLVMSTDKVESLYLDHPIKASPEALKAIKQASHIIYCPGSVYGSVLSNFLPRGITSALKKSRAQKILITNLVSDRNQTHQITLTEYVSLFRKYTGLSKPVDVIICPDLTPTRFNKKYPHVAGNYAANHSYFLGWSQKEISHVTGTGIRVIPADVFTITTRHRLRHDPPKLSRILKAIIK